MSYLYRLFLFAVAAWLASSGAALAQALEEEPNDSCLTAQYFGLVALPFTLNGEISTSDVDYFRFEAAPTSRLVATLEGAASNQGTLPDPYLGVFDANCYLVTSNDDYLSFDSRIEFAVPADGVFILAATGYSDWAFVGKHPYTGTYTLGLSEAPDPGRIEGRLIDASTSLPLPGYTEPYASASLSRCYDADCFYTEWLNYQNADAEGRFSFVSDYSGNALTSGTYQVTAYANGYSASTTTPFVFTAGEILDLGDLALTAIATAGSITGQLVDAVTLLPLAGDVPPYASATLYSCFDSLCTFPIWINTQSADVQGRFLFDGDFVGNPLQTGLYQVVGYAMGYTSASSEVITLGENADVDIGTLALAPPPVTFSDIVPCASLPSTGGTCEYSVRITNNMDTSLRGGAWSLVTGWGTGSYLGSTSFQASLPRRIQLAPGESTVVRFSFYVPSGVSDGASICASTTVGRGVRTSYFDTLADTSLFCLVKGGGYSALMKGSDTGYKVVPKEHAGSILQKQQMLRADPPKGPAR